MLRGIIKRRASTAIGSTRYETATNSICPKGWHLPQGPNGTNGSEFETMLKVAGIANLNNTDNGSGSAVNVGYIGGNLSSTDMENSPYYFARSGNVNDTTLDGLTSNGYYWSGSVVSSSNAFYLNYYSSGLYPAYQYRRNYGRSLRCVAR